MASSSLSQLRRAIAKLDRERVTAILADAPALADHHGDGEPTPLQAACRLVTDDGALPPVDGGPAAHAIVDELLRAGAEPNRPVRPNGATPLHEAAFAGNGPLVERLLAAGADPSATVDEGPGATPLSYALFYAHRSTGAAIARRSRWPDDLRSAAGLDDVAGVERLLGTDGVLAPSADRGMTFTAPIDAFPPRDGPITDQLTIDESLTWAARNGSLRAMAALVARGADVDANPYRGTALLWAVYGGRIEIIDWLVGHGADVNLRHDFGGAEHGRSATALHLAAQFGDGATVETLLGHGADRTITDAAFGATPLGWAEHAGATNTAERLRRP